MPGLVPGRPESERRARSGASSRSIVEAEIEHSLARSFISTHAPTTPKAYGAVGATTALANTKACSSRSGGSGRPLKEIRGALPFPLRGIDSDNGSEFINNELKRYCEQKRITFTRSRAYRKNDGCYVEQKNWPVVRRNVGYARIDTAEELAVLNELYAALREHTNYFMPSAKLVSKTRDGAKVTKRYDEPRTPYARALASEHVTEAAERRLTEHSSATCESPRSAARMVSASAKRSVRLCWSAMRSVFRTASVRLGR